MLYIFKKIIPVLLFCLIPLNTSLCAELGAVRFDKDGSFTIESHGGPRVKGSLFLWHGEWNYATPSEVESVEPNSWRGAMPAPGIASGYISYSQTAKSTPDGGADIALEFYKNGEINLNRGIFLLLQFPRETSGEPVAFTHGLPYIISDDYKASARGFSTNLSESIALEFSSDRACLFEHRGKEGEALMNIRLSPNADAKVNLHLRFKPAFEITTPWMEETHESMLAIHDVKLSTYKVPRFHILDLTIDLSITYDNYFDPDDVEIDALFTAPSGRKIKIPGFIYQEFKAEHEDDLELLSYVGEPVWKIRFAPTEVGTYSVIVNARDRNGRVVSKEQKFECVESDSKGFLGISKPPVTGSPLYFQFDNGDTLFLVGHNMPTYNPNMEEYFAKMQAGGENYTRLWMYSSALGLEWGQPVGFYRLEEAWKLDRILESASKHGIYLMLCFDTHQDFRENWERNPYNGRQGGPCRQPLDFFKDENAHALYKKRLRYIAARWSAYASILAWEFMNEIEGWEGAENNRSVVTKWHAEMGKVLEKLDPYEHPISSSLWTTEGWPELWKLPEMDFVQSHFYANGTRDMAQEVAGICAQKRAVYPDKLHLFAEYGIMSGSGTAENDPSGVHLHNGNWAGFMSGSASVPASWWHESYIDPLGLYMVYRGLANFVAEEKGLAKNAWKPLTQVSVSYIQPPEQLTYTDLRFTGGKNNWQKIADTVFTIRDDGTIENIKNLPSLLHGNTHVSLRVPLTFRFDFPIAGKFILHVGRVGDNGLLKFHLDGVEISSVDLPTGEGLGASSEYVEQWKRWETTYDKDITIDVPAGKHEVQIRNDGRDWIAIDWFQLTNYLSSSRPNLRILGMQASDKALIWVQNKDHTWFRVRDKAPILAVPPTRLALTEFVDGEYRVELWDTVNGTVLEQKTLVATDGTLTVDLPKVEHDIAVKIRRR